MADIDIDKLLENWDRMPDLKFINPIQPIKDVPDFKAAPIVPLLKEIAKSNNANTKEIQQLNKLNEEANAKIGILDGQIKKIQSSHKHDKLKESLIAIGSACAGAILPMIIKTIFR